MRLILWDIIKFVLFLSRHFAAHFVDIRLNRWSNSISATCERISEMAWRPRCGNAYEFRRGFSQKRRKSLCINIKPSCPKLSWRKIHFILFPCWPHFRSEKRPRDTVRACTRSSERGAFRCCTGNLKHDTDRVKKGKSCGVYQWHLCNLFSEILLIKTRTRKFHWHALYVNKKKERERGGETKMRNFPFAGGAREQEIHNESRRFLRAALWLLPALAAKRSRAQLASRIRAWAW